MLCRPCQRTPAALAREGFTNSERQISELTDGGKHIIGDVQNWIELNYRAEYGTEVPSRPQF